MIFSTRQGAAMLSLATGTEVSPGRVSELIPEVAHGLCEPKDLRAAHGLLVRKRQAELAGGLNAKRPARRPPVVVCHFKKGGTGKTSTVLNVALALAGQGIRVLYVDADPQGTSTTLLGVDTEDTTLRTLQHVLFGFQGRPVELAEARRVLFENATLDLIPSDIELSSFDRIAYGYKSREFLVSNLLKRQPEFFASYEIVLVDTNPGTNLLNFNLLVPADVILMPVSLDVPSMKSMRLMSAEAAELAEIGAPAKRMLLVGNGLHASMRHTRESLDALRERYPEEMMATVIPSYAGVARQGWSTERGRTVIEKEPSSSAGVAFASVAAELAEKVLWEPLGLGLGRRRQPVAA